MNAPALAQPSPGLAPPPVGARIRGNSAMARLIRETDWSATALGDLARWPEALLATVNLILSSPIPTSLYWGRQLVLLYNDGYRQFLADRHPTSLGKPGAEVWKEAWHIVGPQIEHTYRTAEAFQGESSLVPIERDGRLVDHYWDYTFSPVHDSRTGRVAGVYNTCTNVTGAFQTARERDGLAQRLQELLETTSEGVIMIDRNWRFTYLNRAAETFSLPIIGLVGKVIWEALPRLVYEGSPNVYHYYRAMDQGISAEFDSFYPEPMNRWRHIQVRPTADGIVLFARDITEEKRADAALKASTDALAASEEELRWTIALSSQKPWTADVQGTILKHSENMTNATGHSSTELLATTWTARMHPDDVDRTEQSWSTSVRTGVAYDVEFRMLTEKGEHHWLRARAYPRRDAEGQIVKWYGITDDIDGQKRAEVERKALNDALAASEEELRWTILLSSQEPWTAEGDGTITKYSANLTAVTGHSSNELLEGKWITSTHPDDVDRIVQSWNTSVRTGQLYDIEFRMLSAAGETRWFRAHAYPRRDAEGKIVKWYGITDDIDERKRRAAAFEHAAAALAASEEELRWTVKMSTQNPWTADAAGKLLSGGDILLERPGQPSELLLDAHWSESIHPNDEPLIHEAWSHAVRTGEPFDIEHRRRVASGEFHWLRARAYPRRDAEGRIAKWYGTTEDIHTRKLAEEGLRTSEKLAAVGRLATSIAHEINNPLEAVTNLLYLARTSDGLPEVLSYIKSAEQELHRASVITNQTLRFQRQSSAPLALYSDDLIENCLAVFQGKLQNTSVVPERRLRALQPVTCYDGEIRQVFLNLVGNAIDAMQANGGRLLIRTREATHPANGKLGLVLTVADTGYGIPPELRKKIFEPFFTTKGLAGTGLGLWVTKNIVDRHHGSLRVRSKPARRKTDLDADGNAHGGTVFTLFLPFEAVARHALPGPLSAERDSAAA